MATAGSTTISRSELLRLRLRSHGLVRPRSVSSADDTASDASGPVLDRLFALQGQDLPGALWSIGVRAAGATRADVVAMFDRGEAVRSWPFRGTLHVLAAVDLPWILRLTTERTLASAARRRRELGLDDATIEAARTVAIETLQGGGGLTRKALLETFDANGLPTDAGRGYHLLWTLSLSGTLVLGPFEGNEQRFVLLDEWIRSPQALDRDEALGELVQRYLAGRGPATEADIAWWSKLPLRDIRTGLAVAGDRLTAFDYAGTPHWGNAATLDLVAADQPRPTVLLPGFDELLLGYGDRSASLEPEHAPLTVPGGNGMFKPTIVHRGRVVGLWSKRSTARRTTVTALPFKRPLSRTTAAGVDRAVRDYGHFLGTTAALANEDQASTTGSP